MSICSQYNTIYGTNNADSPKGEKPGEARIGDAHTLSLPVQAGEKREKEGGGGRRQRG